MGARKQTTVNLTKAAQAIKDKLYPAIDLKGLLSAALVCFDQTISDSDKIKYVNEILSADDIFVSSVKTAGEHKQTRGRTPSKSG